MKLIKFIFIPLLCYCNVSFAEEDLIIKKNRDIFEKMPLISLQPMLNFCREEQPQLNVELEKAYSVAKVKLVNAAKNVKYNGISPLQQKEIDQPVDAAFKHELQKMLEIMSISIRKVDAEKYCPSLIDRLNNFDQAEFQRTVEMQYSHYIDRATQKKKALSQE